MPGVDEGRAPEDVARLVVAVLILVLALTGASPASSQEPAGGYLALEHVAVIDGTGAGAAADMTVLVADGTIEAVFESGTAELPSGTRVHDLSGRYLVPGLINTHVHLLQLAGTGPGDRFFDRDAVLAELRRSLFSGVTTLREAVAGDVLATAEMARAAASGTDPLPDIHFAPVVAGATFFASDERAAADGDRDRPRGILTEDGGLAGFVAWADSVGATGIKIYSDLGPELVRRAAAAARRQGLEVWAHGTVFPTRPADVVAAGVNTISHVCSLPWEILPTVPERFSERPRFDPSDVDPADPRFAELFAEMRRRGVVLDATMYVYTRPANHRRGCVPDLMRSLARAAHEAGVPLSTGTDFFNDPGEPYPSLHLEIVHLVESGVMDADEAIVAATLNGARALGIEASHGSIEPGKVADLVVLGADPTRDIRAIRDVVAVVKGGRLYWRGERGGPGG